MFNLQFCLELIVHAESCSHALAWGRDRQMQASLCRLTCSLSRAVRHASSARTSAAESASAVAKQRDDKSNQTSYPINPRFVNRNPRCLEQLAIAHKRLGWDYQAPLRTYWYKVVFEKSSNNTRAAIVHHQDGEVVSASTREYAVRKHLFRWVSMRT